MLAFQEESTMNKSKSVKLFSVVLFTNEQRYSVVPSSWIEPDGKSCHWPGRKTRNPSALSQDGYSIPDPTFKVYGIQFIKSYGKII